MRGDESTTQPAEPDLQEVTSLDNVAKSLQVTANPRRNKPDPSPCTQPTTVAHGYLTGNRPGYL
jgi:hypothetical protein